MTLVELFYFDVMKLFKITAQFLTLNMMTGYQLIILEFYLDPKICNRWDLPLFSYESQLSNWAIMQQQGVRRVNIFIALLFKPYENPDHCEGLEREWSVWVMVMFGQYVPKYNYVWIWNLYEWLVKIKKKALSTFPLIRTSI